MIEVGDSTHESVDGGRVSNIGGDHLYFILWHPAEIAGFADENANVATGSEKCVDKMRAGESRGTGNQNLSLCLPCLHGYASLPSVFLVSGIFRIPIRYQPNGFS